MKCDELKAYKGDVTIPVYGTIADAKVYLKEKADEAITELKASIADLEGLNHDLCERVTENDGIRQHWEEIEQTRAENERLKAKLVEQDAENRRLKRALWLARAKRATEKADSFIDIKVTYNGVCNIDHSVYPQNNARRMLTCDEWLDVWTNVWEKCLKKAKEYR